MAHTVSAPVAPLRVPVPGAINAGSQRGLPLEPVLQQGAPLHIAAAWEPEEPALR